LHKKAKGSAFPTFCLVNHQILEEILGLYIAECEIAVSAMEIHQHSNEFFPFSNSLNISKSYIGKLVVVLGVLPTG
jgi:hypothetical protein